MKPPHLAVTALHIALERRDRRRKAAYVLVQVFLVFAIGGLIGAGFAMEW